MLRSSRPRPLVGTCAERPTAVRSPTSRAYSSRKVGGLGSGPGSAAGPLNHLLLLLHCSRSFLTPLRGSAEHRGRSLRPVFEFACVQSCYRRLCFLGLQRETISAVLLSVCPILNILKGSLMAPLNIETCRLIGNVR